MSPKSGNQLELALFYAFAVFVIASTFSIALAQTALGIGLAVFIIYSAITGHPSVSSRLRWAGYFALAYVVWMAVACVVGPTPLDSIMVLREEWLFLAVPMGITVLRNSRLRNRLLLLYAAAVMVISIYGLFQHWTGLDWFRTTPLGPAPDGGYRVAGFFTHRLTYGLYFAVAGLFLWGFGWRSSDDLDRYARWFFLTAAVLAMVSSALTYSRGALAAIIVGVIAVGVMSGRRMALRTLALVAIGVVVLFALRPGLVGRFSNNVEREFGGEYEGGRAYIWRRSVKIIGEHPVFGVGKGNFGDEYAQEVEEGVPDFRIHTHPHNDLLNVTAVSGIPAGLLYVGLWITVLTGLAKILRMSRQYPEFRRSSLAGLAGSIGFIVASVGEATFADEEIRQLLMFVWAAGLWPWWSRQAILVETVGEQGGITKTS